MGIHAVNLFGADFPDTDFEIRGETNSMQIPCGISIRKHDVD